MLGFKRTGMAIGLIASVGCGSGDDGSAGTPSAESEQRSGSQDASESDIGPEGESPTTGADNDADALCEAFCEDQDQANCPSDPSIDECRDDCREDRIVFEPCAASYVEYLACVVSGDEPKLKCVDGTSELDEDFCGREVGELLRCLNDVEGQ